MIVLNDLIFSAHIDTVQFRIVIQYEAEAAGWHECFAGFNML